MDARQIPSVWFMANTTSVARLMDRFNMVVKLTLHIVLEPHQRNVHQQVGTLSLRYNALAACLTYASTRVASWHHFGHTRHQSQV